MLKSTMAAPLSPGEEARIRETWECLSVTMETALSATTPDPLEMLDFMTDTIMRIYEVRRAINDGWHNANVRAWPGPKAGPKVARSKLLLELDVTEDELANALAIVRGTGDAT